MVSRGWTGATSGIPKLDVGAWDTVVMQGMGMNMMVLG